MDFNNRQSDSLESVVNGDRSVGIGGGIDEDRVGGLRRILNPGHELALMVGLPEITIQPKAFTGLSAQSLNPCKGRVTIDTGLTGPKKIEIGSVKHQNAFGHFRAVRVCLFSPVRHRRQVHYTNCVKNAKARRPKG